MEDIFKKDADFQSVIFFFLEIRFLLGWRAPCFRGKMIIGQMITDTRLYKDHFEQLEREIHSAFVAQGCMVPGWQG
jgi:hypothetical protein